jgi:hypothetical protein
MDALQSAGTGGKKWQLPRLAAATNMYRNGQGQLPAPPAFHAAEEELFILDVRYRIAC